MKIPAVFVKGGGYCEKDTDKIHERTHKEISHGFDSRGSGKSTDVPCNRFSWAATPWWHRLLARGEHYYPVVILELNKKLIAAKTEAVESSKDLKQMYQDAVKAMKRYSGQGDDDYDET